MVKNAILPLKTPIIGYQMIDCQGISVVRPRLIKAFGATEKLSMRKIILISCVKTKRQCRAKARDLYISSLFKLNYRYAQSLNPDAIYVLSAKYNLVDIEKEIDPYELTLKTMSAQKVKAWAVVTLRQLKVVSDFENDKFVFLAGEKYRKYLLPFISNYEIPLEGLGIGKQMAWLKRETEVSRYIQRNFTFVVFEVNSKSERLSIESKIISTISLCDCCKPSKKWLGSCSPKPATSGQM